MQRTCIVLVAALLGATSASAQPAGDELLGWQEFRFGMDAAEVDRVAKSIPITCYPMPPGNIGGRVQFYEGRVRIADVPLNVGFVFQGVPAGTSGCFGGKLTEIDFTIENARPCPARQLLQALETAYGKFEVHEPSAKADAAPPDQFIRRFADNTMINGAARGSNTHCSVGIAYVASPAALPALPVAPVSRF
jgi:hypothetical protein